MIKIPFTKEQKEVLVANPFTLSVNDYQIRFTVEFKKYLIAERKKNGTPWKEIFRKAGYDPTMLGKNRIDSIIKTIRKESVSKKGLHETAAKKSKNLEAKQTQKAIRELQEEVLHLQQQIEFLKKLQMLNVMDTDEE